MCDMAKLGKQVEEKEHNLWHGCIIFAEKYKGEGDRRRKGIKGWELEVNYVRETDLSSDHLSPLACMCNQALLLFSPGRRTV